VQVAREVRGLLATMRSRLRGRDTALIAAGLTFYAGFAVVPALVLSLALTSWIAGADRVRDLMGQLASVLPGELGAPDAVARLADAGTRLGVVGALLTLLPISLYGEGLRRALLRFSPAHDRFTAWRGRLASLPLLLLAPLLVYPLLLVARLLARLSATPGFGATAGAFFAGYYSVLFALTLPLVWVFRVVAAGRLRWRAVVVGALFTAGSLSGFLQGFVLFLSLPLELGAPFGGITVVGGAVAVAFWLFLLQFVLLAGWLFTEALDERVRRGTPAVSR
jgi:membrane protein